MAKSGLSWAELANASLACFATSRRHDEKHAQDMLPGHCYNHGVGVSMFPWRGKEAYLEARPRAMVLPGRVSSHNANKLMA